MANYTVTKEIVFEVYKQGGPTIHKSFFDLEGAANCIGEPASKIEGAIRRSRKYENNHFRVYKRKREVAHFRS